MFRCDAAAVPPGGSDPYAGIGSVLVSFTRSNAKLESAWRRAPGRGSRRRRAISLR